MPDDLTVSAAGIPALASGSTAAAPVAPVTNVAKPAAALPNPSLRLDAALGIVVLEFRSDEGAFTSSYPTDQQLLAYQSERLTRPPELPSLSSDSSRVPSALVA